MELPAGEGAGCPRCLLSLGLDESAPDMPERLGPYTIVSRLGAGGMGEVYRARDTRLDRDVAIKVLPDLVADDPERTARFRREARVAASLNHPNIAGIYGFEDEDGAHFLVMELVEGITLAERLRSGMMPADEALVLVEQIASGLEAAHEGGVVHRDLKPANIKITPTGQAKILDFGLAKVVDDSPSGQALEYTSPGTVFGTVPYMSPEQARGRVVDKRSDIWSLGCVLYECLCGQRAFDGDTATDVVAKILERDPSWDALPPQTPARVRELLESCLEKDPKRRVRDCGDVRIELERARAARVPNAGQAASRRVLLWSAAGLALVLALVWFVNAGRGASSGQAPFPTAASTGPMHVVMTDPDIPHLNFDDSPSIAISPDGLTIAYTGRGPKGAGPSIGLYIRRADEIHARRIELPCDQQTNAPRVYDPFFSPDGTSLGFSCLGLYRVPLSGGPAVQIAESAVVLKGATWSPDGIIFSPTAKAGLVLAKAGGGPLETLTVPDADKGEVSHRWPSALPDGRHVLFTIKKAGITTFDQGEIALLDLGTRTYNTLIRGGTFARYLPTGHIVFARGSSLFAVAFDLSREQIVGNQVAVAEGVMTEPGSGAAQFAVARDTGTLVFVPGGVAIVRQELVWIDRKGAVTPVGAPLQAYFSAFVSPDGGRLASTVFGATDTVVVYDLAQRSLSRLASDGNCAVVAWTPDGREILYGSDQEEVGKQVLMMRNADGTGTPRRLILTVESYQAFLLARLSDGLGFVYGGNGALWLSRLSGDTTPQRIGGEVPPGSSTLSQSPDGRWLAYSSDASGRSEVYVKPFPTGSGTWQVSRGGGQLPAWSSRGDELFFRRQSGDDTRISSARIATTDRQIVAAAPVDLFKIPPGLVVWGPHPDGTRFIAVRELAPAFKGDRVEAVLNWGQHVEARAPGR